MIDEQGCTLATEVRLTLPQNHQYDMVMQDLEGKLVGSFGGFTKHHGRGCYKMADGSECFESIVVYTVLVEDEVMDKWQWFELAKMLKLTLRQEAVLLQFTATTMRLV